MTAFQSPEPTPESTTSPDDSNIPYFPEYFGGTVTSILAQAVFYVLFLIFVIKLVKWGGRAYFMIWTKFYKSKEIVVTNYDLDVGGRVSVGWHGQFKSTMKKAFRDWCWPPAPVRPTPFQNWLDKQAQELDRIFDDIHLTTYRTIGEDLRSCLSKLDKFVINFSSYVDKTEQGKSRLDWIGADKEAIEKVRAVRDDLSITRERLVSVSMNEKFSEDIRRELCGYQLTFISHSPNTLRLIAAYGKYFPLSSGRDFLHSTTAQENS